MQREIKRDDQQDRQHFAMFPPRASFPPVRNHCLIKCHLASIQPQKVAVAVEFLPDLECLRAEQKKNRKERNDRRAVCPGLRRPLLSLSEQFLAWETEGRADLPVGRGSVMTPSS